MFNELFPLHKCLSRENLKKQSLSGNEIICLHILHQVSELHGFRNHKCQIQEYFGGIRSFQNVLQLLLELLYNQ